MILQNIKERLNETRGWYVVLTAPHKERKTKETLENKGMITYFPTLLVRRYWKEKVRKIQIPAINRCIFIYATDREIEAMKGTYSIEVAEMGD